MGEVEIREYRPTDYIRINRREFDKKIFSNIPNPMVAAYNLARGPSFTGVYEGEIVGCGGVILFWKGVGEAWLITSPLVDKFRLTFAKTIHRKLEELIKSLDLERVQAIVDAEFKTGQKFIERMGFINETPSGMKKYIGGRTFYRYALIKGNGIPEVK
jgi:hypothetical protein